MVAIQRQEVGSGYLTGVALFAIPFLALLAWGRAKPEAEAAAKPPPPMLTGTVPVPSSGISYVLRRNDITFVVTGALSPDGEVAEHVHKHGDGVKDIAFSVDDAAAQGAM